MPEQAETSNAARPHLDPAQYAARLDERALLASFLRFFAGLGLGMAAGSLIEPTLGPWIGLVCGGFIGHHLGREQALLLRLRAAEILAKSRTSPTAPAGG